MRLLIEFISKGDYRYELDNYYIQGFIYSKLKGTDFEYIHDRKGSKFFCFSNIFPIGDYKKDEKKYLIISSPMKEFIKTLYERISSEIGEVVKIGEKKFLIANCKEFDVKLKFPWETSTPIILRSAWDIYIESNGRCYKFRTKNFELKKKLEEYKHENSSCKNFEEISEDFLKKLNDIKVVKIKDIYFSFNKGDTLFEWLEKLKENSIKKFKEYYNEDINFDEPIFDEISFRKEVSIKLRIKGKEAIFVGSTWKALSVIRKMDKKQRKFYKFLLDTGLGVLNSLGFGFVNVLNPKSPTVY